MTTDHQELLDRAVITLMCALAFDEARQCGAPPDELEVLRGHWVSYAQDIVAEAEDLGLLDYEGMEEFDVLTLLDEPT